MKILIAESLPFENKLHFDLSLAMLKCVVNWKILVMIFNGVGFTIKNNHSTESKTKMSVIRRKNTKCISRTNAMQKKWKRSLFVNKNEREITLPSQRPCDKCHMTIFAVNNTHNIVKNGPSFCFSKKTTLFIFS